MSCPGLIYRTVTSHGYPMNRKEILDEGMLEECDTRILLSLRKIIHAVDSYSRKLRSQHGITLPQLMCLMSIVDRDGDVCTSDIGRDIHVSSSTVVGILDRLESKGLATRQRCTQDRRRVLVRLTHEGKTMVRNAPSPLQKELSDALAALPRLEQMAIALSLEKIVVLMGADKTENVPLLGASD